MIDSRAAYWNWMRRYWTARSAGTAYFVRPSGGTYGSEDGTSYDNAWDGFSNIDWSKLGLGGSTLYVAGVHTEALTVGASNVTIRGDYDGDAGTINSQDTRAAGITILNKDNVTISSLTSIDALTSCLSIEGTSSGIVTNDLVLTGSGNQALQHLNTCSATHNNVTCTDCVDDGISAHDSATVIVNTATIDLCSTGINTIDDAQLTLDNITITNATSHVLINAGTTTKATISNSTFGGLVHARTGGTIDASDCIFNDELKLENGSGLSATFDRCVINDFNNNGSHDVTVNDSLILLPAYGVTTTLNRCRVMSDGDVTTGQTLTLNHCNLSGVDGVSSHTIVVSAGGTLNAYYSVFQDQRNSQFAISNAGAANIVGCTVDGDTVGRGIASSTTITIYNTIIANCGIGLSRSAGTFTAENCCLFNNSTDKSGTITSNDEVTGNPNFVNETNLDYRLDTGSSCIGKGDNTPTESTGIATADWGNGTDELPVVTTKEQGAIWDIGAYIS